MANPRVVKRDENKKIRIFKNNACESENSLNLFFSTLHKSCVKSNMLTLMWNNLIDVVVSKVHLVCCEYARGFNKVK